MLDLYILLLLAMKDRHTTIRLSEERKEKLSAIAYTLDCKWGDKGNITKLLEDIADNKLLVVKNFSITP
jgi:hypothetical protein